MSALALTYVDKAESIMLSTLFHSATVSSENTLLQIHDNLTAQVFYKIRLLGTCVDRLPSHNLLQICAKSSTFLTALSNLNDKNSINTLTYP